MNSSESTKEEREEFIKKLEKKTADQGVVLPKYIVDQGGDEMRNLMQRMIKAELKNAPTILTRSHF